jgi:hypothetical protein
MQSMTQSNPDFRHPFIYVALSHTHASCNDGLGALGALVVHCFLFYTLTSGTNA